MSIYNPVPYSLIKLSSYIYSYCDHLITEDLCKITEQLLKDLFRFQSRAYEKNSIKATAHRRYVVGFKETNRQLQIRKVKLLLISPDLEPNEGEGKLIFVTSLILDLNLYKLQVDWMSL